MIFSPKANQEHYPFVLPELPYDPKALEPHISAETFLYHHTKHHAGYVNKLNELIAYTNFTNTSLELIILDSARKPELRGVFNNAAQVWNHTFFWHSMKQNGGGQPQGQLAAAINRDFSSFTNFLHEFETAGSHFGSGWIWLIKDHNNKLRIVATTNAEAPITDSYQPLLVCDIWEHAYYIDFRNERIRYIKTFLTHLVNWEFAEYNYTRVLG